MKNKILKVLKSNIDELYLRKSLYWINTECLWEINDENECWSVCLSCDSSNIEKEYMHLNALVNDHIIRYKLSSNLQTTRERIISNALSKLALDE
jgi:His-Xaa-Ser system protein HxsD